MASHQKCGEYATGDGYLVVSLSAFRGRLKEFSVVGLEQRKNTVREVDEKTW